MSGITRQDRAFQAIRIRNLNNPLVKLLAELKTKIFQIVFNDVSSVLCQRRDQLTCVDLKLDLNTSSVYCLNSSVP
jgi:hypothetical protein